MSHILEVKKHPSSDDLYIEFPEDLLKRMEWKTGDVINWERNNDGSFSLRKLNVTILEKKLAEIKSLWGEGDPVYSKHRWLEKICIFCSTWRYQLTKGLYFKVKYWIQRHTRGYDDLDKWNAAWYIARKAIPVLQAMREGFHGTSIKWHHEDRFGNIVELTRDEAYAEDPPNAFTEDEWRAVLDDIIFAFQFTLKEDNIETFSQEQYEQDLKRHKRGLRLLSIYYMNLWD